MRIFSIAAIFMALLSATTSHAAVIVSENFETSSPPDLPPAWSGRGDLVITGTVTTEDSGGNLGKDLLLMADSTAASISWRLEAIYTFAGPLPTDDLSQLRFTADLKANEQGAQYVFAMRSHERDGSTSGKADFSGLTSTDFAPIGGLLSQASSSKALDTNSEIFSIHIWMEGRSSSFGFDQGNWLRFDNLVLAQVPEPSTYALGLIGFVALLALKRRKALA